MLSSVTRLCLTFFLPYVTAQEMFVTDPFRAEKVLHSPSTFNDTQLSKIAAMTNTTHMNKALDHICIPRVVGSEGHAKVQQYLKDSMTNLGWSVESDVFYARTPIKDNLRFENIIAKLNPNARRYLVLAGHYDSLYVKNGSFVGATDSAVPCAQLLNLATVMKEHLDAAKTSNVSLVYVFFDGEEAFEKWSVDDSIYGAKHLAKKWSAETKNYGYEGIVSDLDRIDMLVLLDLLGASDPQFYNYFRSTTRWYSKLVQAERSLAKLRKFANYSYDSRQTLYFKSYPDFVRYGVEDDHIPFLQKNVPIVHLIPYGFPSFWHTSGDNRDIVDMDTTENLNKILRVFVASYLNLDI